MEKSKRTIRIVMPVIVLLFVIAGGFLYKDSVQYFRSNHYLSSKNEARSVDSMVNEKDFEDGKSFDFYKFSGKWSIIEFTAEKDTDITIHDYTKISEGLFYIVVLELDSDYNILIKREETDENTNIDFTVHKGGKYVIGLLEKMQRVILI